MQPTAAALELMLELWRVYNISEEDPDQAAEEVHSATNGPRLSTAVLHIFRELINDGGTLQVGHLVEAQQERRPPITPDAAAGERILAQYLSTRVTAFGAARGRLTLSTAAVYFQPFINSPGQPEVMRQALPTLCFLMQRQHISRGGSGSTPVGLLDGFELYFMAKQSLLVVFDTPAVAVACTTLLFDGARVKAPNLSRITATELQQLWCVACPRISTNAANTRII
jgi:hypothetical protein